MVSASRANSSETQAELVYKMIIAQELLLKLEAVKKIHDCMTPQEKDILGRYL